MARVVLLDAGPLGMITHPRAETENKEITEWLRNLLLWDGGVVRIPEIADYEVRRELLRANKRKGIGRLDRLKAAIGYEPLNTEIMLSAAQLWADVRRRGRPTAADEALDGDVILAAQAKMLEGGGQKVVVATTNVGHLNLFVEAKTWEEI